MNAIKVISVVKIAATISTLALAVITTYFLPTMNLTNWCSWCVTEHEMQYNFHRHSPVQKMLFLELSGNRAFPNQAGQPSMKT